MHSLKTRSFDDDDVAVGGHGDAVAEPEPVGPDLDRAARPVGHDPGHGRVRRGEVPGIREQDRAVTGDAQVVRGVQPTDFGAGGQDLDGAVRLDTLQARGSRVRGRDVGELLDTGHGDVDAAVLCHEHAAVTCQHRPVGAAARLGQRFCASCLDVHGIDAPLDDGRHQQGPVGTPDRTLTEQHTVRDYLGLRHPSSRLLAARP